MELLEIKVLAKIEEYSKQRNQAQVNFQQLCGAISGLQSMLEMIRKDEDILAKFTENLERNDGDIKSESTRQTPQE